MQEEAGVYGLPHSRDSWVQGELCSPSYPFLFGKRIRPPSSLSSTSMPLPMSTTSHLNLVSVSARPMIKNKMTRKSRTQSAFCIWTAWWRDELRDSVPVQLARPHWLLWGSVTRVALEPSSLQHTD